MIDIMDLESKLSIDVYPRRDITIVDGKGAIVRDSMGRSFVDCVGGHGCAAVGHSNPEVASAVARQAKRLISCPGVFYNDVRAEFLEVLIGVAPRNIERAFLCNSGTESIEAAIKMARFTTGKTDFVCAYKGFHGRTMGALSATFNPRYRRDFMPLVEGFSFIPFNDFKALESAITEKTAAVLLEIVQGEGGVNVGSKEYFKAVSALCKEKGILLIIDEVQTGFCRTGKMFAVEHFDLDPNIICVAKAIAGGFPMGAVLCSHGVFIKRGKHGSTFGGNPLACAAGRAAINYMLKNNLAQQSYEKGKYLLNGLKNINSDRIKEVRGLGLMVGIELKEKSKPYIIALIEEGVLTLPAGSNVIRLLPPLVIEYKQLEFVIDKIGKVLEDEV